MWFEVAIVGTPLVLLAGSVAFVVVYADRADKSALSSTVATFAIFLAMCTIFLLPFDLFTLGDRAGTLSGYHEGIKIAYLVFYCLLAAFAFFLLPFAYFFYEEEDGTGETFPQAVRACKYTVGVVIAIIAIVSLAYVVRLGKLDPSSSTVDDLLSFVVGAMLTVGLAGWVSYTAYGLAYLPLQALQVTAEAPDRSLSLTAGEEVEAELLRIHAQIEYLQARYMNQPSSAWSKEDRLELVKLEHRERQLAQQQDAVVREVERLPSAPSFLSRIMHGVIGVVYLLLSLLVATSLLLGTIDRGLNSTCGFSCGFQIDGPSLPDPIGLLLVLASSAFPADLICFAVLVGYLFVATLTGIIQLGVRILCIRLYAISPRRTKPNAMMMAIWLLLFLLVAINVQILVLAPQYATFGPQAIAGPDGESRPCRLHDWQDDVSSTRTPCALSELARFNKAVFANIPLIGTLTFVSNILLLIVMCCTSIWTLCVVRRRAHLRDIEGTDDLAEYLVS
ncbi:Lysosomal cobalamin transporter [Plasmodiophora brassicae]